MKLTMRRRRPDLPTRLLPPIAPENWKNPGEALQILYEDAQTRAIEICDWYMADRLGRKRASRVLRGLALVLAAAGGLVPLANVTIGQSVSGWGYLFLALAGVCFGFDHYLGLSTGWMRDIATAQRVQRRLQSFQFAWMELNAVEARKDCPESSPLPYLELLRDFAHDLSDLVIGETDDWVAEFQTGLQQLESVASRK
jgi:SMODS and SLOG-associating 2TM effector domain 2